MTVKSFFLTMGAGVAVGALGAMMLPKNSDAYRMTKQAAKAIQSEAVSRRRHLVGDVKMPCQNLPSQGRWLGVLHAFPYEGKVARRSRDG